ncbi:HdeD family acid-resistance protein [Haloarchaeobius sp. DFWS5]|uniref:HdeD family acid-resistance protein n=1 Tax=Haloarchaeobius sp. DFWS5 TaxID=3446114 RepID=UPI003EB6EDED
MLPTMTPTTTDQQQGPSKTALRYVGAGLVLLGLFAVVFPMVSSFSLAFVVGSALGVAGVLQVANALAAPKWTGFVWQALLAVVFLVLGVLIIANPTLGLTTVTLLLIAEFAAAGIVQILLGVGIRGHRNWQAPILSGAFSLVASVLLGLGVVSTAVGIGSLFGATLVVTGLALLILSLGASDETASDETTPPAPRAGGV